MLVKQSSNLSKQTEANVKSVLEKLSILRGVRVFGFVRELLFFEILANDYAAKQHPAGNEVTPYLLNLFT